MVALELADDPVHDALIEVVAARCVSPLVDFTRTGEPSRVVSSQDRYFVRTAAHRPATFRPSSCQSVGGAAVGSLMMRARRGRRSFPHPSSLDAESLK